MRKIKKVSYNKRGWFPYYNTTRTEAYVQGNLFVAKDSKKGKVHPSENFTAKNFVVTKSVFGKGILFGNLEKDFLQLTSATRESCGEKSFKRVILSLLPKKMLPLMWHHNMAYVGRP